MSDKFEYWEKPHWKDREAYPHPGTELADWRWRWEFLRRDPDYQRIWSEAREIEGSVRRYPDPSDIVKCKLHYRLEKLFAPDTADIGEKDIFDSIVGPLMRGRNPLVPSVEALGGERIQRGRGSGKQIIPGGGPNGWAETFGRIYAGISDEYPIIEFYFDVSKPLKPQLKLAQKHLTEKQKLRAGRLVQFRKRQDLWPVYLRLLDAEHQGNPKPMKIWRYFMKESEALSVEAYDRLNVENPAALILDWQKQAKELRDKAISYL